MRQCIVTRQSLPEDELIRFVLSPDAEVVPDLARKLPGRGTWVSLSRQKVAEAVRKQLFRRGFETDCHVPDDLADRVGALLRQQALSHLMLARKAGEAVSGTAKVEEALARGPVQILFHAKEASQDGCRKIDRAAQPGTVISAAFTSAEMDLAFGRANVVHAAVASGGLASRLAHYIGRMAKYEGTQ
jgi:uncharacterized protein